MIALTLYPIADWSFISKIMEVYYLFIYFYFLITFIGVMKLDYFSEANFGY